ncbi:acetylcholine receptor subunit alpha-like [Artemia franciscana]|uniref:acetylcholine receptor subunit alpha-like n=1 Tax=Artemia franciscana TaxID=6661 RepID=UPI0032DA8D03
MVHQDKDVHGNSDAKRLYDDLLSNYNKLVRPVKNVSDPLKVEIKLKLSQLIDVNLKNQIMTTNLWVEQYWVDYKLAWDPEEYGGVEILHVPSENIWRPDIVLYNNADGNFEVTLATKATMQHTGRIEWKPPAIYKSSCEIDVEYFPFDEQTCVMKFGSWTYDGFQVDLRHVDEDKERSRVVNVGVDLSEFYMSVEWDILDVPAVRTIKTYACCEEPYLDITFNITMRRKTLFYTVNLIIPCMGISFLTVLVFYLPSDSGEKWRDSVSSARLDPALIGVSEEIWGRYADPEIANVSSGKPSFAEFLENPPSDFSNPILCSGKAIISDSSVRRDPHIFSSLSRSTLASLEPYSKKYADPEIANVSSGKPSFAEFLENPPSDFSNPILCSGKAIISDSSVRRDPHIFSSLSRSTLASLEPYSKK